MSLTEREALIIAADNAATRRCAERLDRWAEQAVRRGREHRHDAVKRAAYGAKAGALFAAARGLFALIPQTTEKP